MGEKFIKPRREVVNPIPYITKIVGDGLVKDLYDNEEVCSLCNGSGMVKASQSFGIYGDPDNTNGMFPYLNQSFTACPMCNGGVVRKCKLCGEIMPRYKLIHNCQQQQALDDLENKRRKQLEIDNAPELPEEKYKDYDFFYSENYGCDNGYFENFDEFFEYWEEIESDSSEELERPEYAWVADKIPMSIDAYDIVENACEELYEDAFEDIPEGDLKELQEMLDKWCAECGVGYTYYESHKYKVRIPWEEYKK